MKQPGINESIEEESEVKDQVSRVGVIHKSMMSFNDYSIHYEVEEIMHLHLQ